MITQSQQDSRDEQAALLDGDDAGEGSEGVDYEEAVAATGYGKFHWLLLAICGWAQSSDAIEVLCISFVLPAATCDLTMNSQMKGWVNAIVFIGMMIGGYFWGSLADINGRRAVLVFSLVVNGVGGLLSSFCQNYAWFLVCRFVSGVGVGGTMPVIFSYFSEFQSKYKRGPMISALATFWMCGNVVAAGLAWMIIPRTEIDFRSGSGFVFNSWRMFVAVCTIPCLSSAILFIWMPESPLYLMRSGREQRAIQVLRRMYKYNHGSSSEYPVRRLCVNGEADRQREKQAQQATVLVVKGKVTTFFTSALRLFRRPHRRTFLIMIIIFSTLSFGYYGLWMWLPELFTRIEKYGGTPCSPGAGNSTLNTSSPCVVELTETVYLESFLTSLSNLPGNILTIFIIDKVGRKLLLSTSMIVSGLTVLFILLLRNRTESVVLSCVFGGISVIGWNVLDVIGVELFPTEVRSTANGILTSIGRVSAILGNLAFGQFIDVTCAIPLVLVTGFMCFGGLCTVILPSTGHRPLQ